MRPALLGLALASLLVLADAHPPAATNASCTQHPSTAIGAHATPKADSVTSIVLLNQDGTLATSVCPGATYSLQVSFGKQSREALVTASDGVGISANASAPCPNRLTLRPGNTTLFARLTLACNAVVSGGAVTINVTSSASRKDNLWFATVTLAVATSCSPLLCGPQGQSPAPVNAFMPPLPSPPPVPRTLSCSPSTLNYSCSYASGPMVIHWSLGKSAPVNHCTAGAGTGADVAGSGDEPDTLHMAMEVPTSGYVALGFGVGSKMTPSDAVLGWVDGSTATVNTYNIPNGGYDYITADNHLTSSWTTARGISQSKALASSSSSSGTGATTITTLCFSRPLVAPSASVSSALSAASTLSLVWAAASDGVTDPTAMHELRGAVSLNLATGTATQVKARGRLSVVVLHGVLMAVAWALLFPLGSIIARHKRLFGEHKLLGTHTWFQAHRALQLSATALFLAGLVCAWAFLGVKPTGSPVRRAHGGLGTAVVAMTFLQILMIGIRPKPDAPRRHLWNLLHHNLGRFTILAAWVAIYLGLQLIQATPAYRSAYVQWLVPVTIVIALLVGMEAGLTISCCCPGSDAASSGGSSSSSGSGLVAEKQEGASQGASSGPATAPNTKRDGQGSGSGMGSCMGSGESINTLDCDLVAPRVPAASSSPPSAPPGVPCLSLSPLPAHTLSFRASTDCSPPVSSRNVVLCAPASSRRLSVDSVDSSRSGLFVVPAPASSRSRRHSFKMSMVHPVHPEADTMSMPAAEQLPGSPTPSRAGSSRRLPVAMPSRRQSSLSPGLPQSWPTLCESEELPEAAVTPRSLSMLRVHEATISAPNAYGSDSMSDADSRHLQQTLIAYLSHAGQECTKEPGSWQLPTTRRGPAASASELALAAAWVPDQYEEGGEGEYVGGLLPVGQGMALGGDAADAQNGTEADEVRSESYDEAAPQPEQASLEVGWQIVGEGGDPALQPLFQAGRPRQPREVGNAARRASWHCSNAAAGMAVPFATLTPRVDSRARRGSVDWSPSVKFNLPRTMPEDQPLSHDEAGLPEIKV